MRTTRAIFVGALAAVAVSVVMQGCSGNSGGSGFDDPNANGGDGGSHGDGSSALGDGGGINFGDAGLHDGGANLDDAGCATATASASKQPVYMLIVLDGSGSMNQDNKWAAVVPALDAFFADPTAMNDKSFGVGITVFSDQNDPQCGGGFGCSGPYNSINVPIAMIDSAHSAALKQRIDSTQPNDGTPTVAVLQGQYPALENFNPASGGLDANGKKVLVLMTDGVPNDLAGTPTATLQQQCISMAQTELGKSAPQGPITTFVVGVGNYSPLDTTNYDPAFLGHLAQAGGAPNAGCDPNNTNDPTKMCHFQVTPGGQTAQQIEQQFLAAINAIRGQIASCTFTLQTNGGQVDPTKVNVVYNDGSGNKTTVPQDPTNGWTYDNPSNPHSVTLHGTSCDTMKQNAHGSISIILGCATITK